MRMGLLVTAVLIAGLVIANNRREYAELLQRYGYLNGVVYSMSDWLVDSGSQCRYDASCDNGKEPDCRLEAENDGTASSKGKAYERHYSICMTVLLSFMTMVMLFFLVKPRKKK